MFFKLEGLVLSKIAYRERDLIVNLLLRNGMRATVLFFGARSKNGRSGPVPELGFMVKAEVRKSVRRGEESTSFVASNQWQLLWSYHDIRKRVDSFYWLCFYLELLKKVSSDASLPVIDGHGDGGIFCVASNAVFYLEEAVREGRWHAFLQGVIFLAKLIFELGIGPNLKDCLVCKEQLSQKLCFVEGEGGFICDSCQTDQLFASSVSSVPPKVLGREIFNLLNWIRGSKYGDYWQLEQALGFSQFSGALPDAILRSAFLALFHHLCHCMQWNENFIVSSKLIIGRN